MGDFQKLYQETATEVEKVLGTITNQAFLEHKDTDIVQALIFNMSTTRMSLKVQGIKNDWRYSSPEHFILAHGYYAKGLRKLPKGFKMMEPKQCFGNAQELALMRRNVVYVEGAVTSAIGAVKHAWVRDVTNPIIDVTLRSLAKPDRAMAKALFDAGHAKSVQAGLKPLGTKEDDESREYFGVPISGDYVRESALAQEFHTCLIDNWERQWPLLNADEELLKLVLVR